MVFSRLPLGHGLYLALSFWHRFPYIFLLCGSRLGESNLGLVSTNLALDGMVKSERDITDFERYAIRKNAHFFGFFREIYKSRTIL